MSEPEKRGWEDELNAAWAEVNKARRELAGAVEALRRIAESAAHPSLTVRSTDYMGKVARDALARLGERTP